MSDSSNIQAENQFVYRLVTAKCSYGSMSHPLNVAEIAGGHGVLFGPEAQPVLNANDWQPGVNVIHFGDCTPRDQNMETGEVIEKKGFDKFWSGVVEFFTAQKCLPMIDQVWYETADKYLIDGAPALLMKGMLFCKRGGIITIEAVQNNAEDGEDALKTSEEIQAEMDQVTKDVDAAVDQALDDGKISEETAQFMKDGYKEALAFADGDVELANQLFSDLTTGGGEKAYSSSGPQFDKFKLYLEHKESPLTSSDGTSMTLNVSEDSDMPLNEAVSTALAHSQEQNEKEEAKAAPIILDVLGC